MQAHRRSRWFWLPALVTAVGISPMLMGFALFSIGDPLEVALVVGLVAPAVLTYAVATWQEATIAEALGFAVLAVAVALGFAFMAFSGVR